MSRTLAAVPILLTVVSLAQAGTIPRPAPEFVVRLTDDSQILLSQMRGKVVAMEILLTTCPHCKAASKVLTKLQNEWGPRGLQCIGVAIDVAPKLNLPGFVAETAASYPVGYCEYNTTVAFLQPDKPRMLVPQVMIIDRKGIIRAHRGGEDDEFFKDEEKVLRTIIEPLLNERTTPAVKKTGGLKKSVAKKK
jgi:peroxiredoxin